ncbi:antitermination regulator [Nocardia jiangsuensis]|uniref:Antitermination regulator n=1 Tax=Nocardia jiangsuensis TaxID=1691563 RepID=A0ABV8DQH8_9NOCA
MEITGDIDAAHRAPSNTGPPLVLQFGCFTQTPGSGTSIQTDDLWSMLLRDLHPDDHAALRAALGQGQGFCLRLRGNGEDGRERTLLVVAAPVTAAPGRVAGFDGFWIDLTPALEAEQKAVLDDELSRFTTTGAVVEQAVGMLRLVYGIPAAKAREILRWRAAETGLHLVEFADLLCTTAIGIAVPAPTRTRVDDVLLTAHRRIDRG